MIKKSAYLRSIGDGDTRLYYHSLFGNLFLLENVYISVLEDTAPSRFVGTHDDIIADLKQHYYLVDDSVDERSILLSQNASLLRTIAEGNTITSLDLNVSELCNFACPHCMNGARMQSGTHKLMPWHIAKAAIDQYAAIIARRGLSGEVHFGSAEPLLNWATLKKAISYFKEVLPRGEVSVYTNLSLVSTDIAIFLRDNGVSVGSSLDGPKQGNDRIRLRQTGGTYDVIMAGLRVFSEIGYPLDAITVTINDLNIDYIDEAFILFLKGLGILSIATDIDLVNVANCEDTVDVYVNKLLSLHKVCKENQLDNAGSWSSIYSFLVAQEHDGPITHCRSQAGRVLSVNPDGNIFLCGYSTTNLGSIHNLTGVFSSDSRYTQFLATRLSGTHEACAHCELEGLCSGQCLITTEFSANADNRRKFAFLCDLYKTCTRELLVMKLQSEVSSALG